MADINTLIPDINTLIPDINTLIPDINALIPDINALMPYTNPLMPDTFSKSSHLQFYMNMLIGSLNMQIKYFASTEYYSLGKSILQK